MNRARYTNQQPTSNQRQPTNQPPTTNQNATQIQMITPQIQHSAKARAAGKAHLFGRRAPKQQPLRTACETKSRSATAQGAHKTTTTYQKNHSVCAHVHAHTHTHTQTLARKHTHAGQSQDISCFHPSRLTNNRKSNEIPTCSIIMPRPAQEQTQSRNKMQIHARRPGKSCQRSGARPSPTPVSPGYRHHPRLQSKQASKRRERRRQRVRGAATSDETRARAGLRLVSSYGTRKRIFKEAGLLRARPLI